MKLTDFLSESHVLIRVPEARNKRDFLGYLVREGMARGLLPADHEKDILNSLLDREGIGSSGIGEGVAVPHCRCQWVTRPVVLMATAPEGVPFDAVDREPVRIVAVLVYPEQEQRTYLQALAMVARILRDRERREALIQSNDAAEFYRLITGEEEPEVERIAPTSGHILLLVLHEECYYDAAMEAFIELGILNASVIESVLVTRGIQDYLPLYAGLLGSREKTKRSRMIIGVTRDPQAGKKLVTLLSKAGCDLLQPEVGVIVVVPVSDVLGGIPEDTDAC